MSSEQEGLLSKKGKRSDISVSKTSSGSQYEAVDGLDLIPEDLEDPETISGRQSFFKKNPTVAGIGFFYLVFALGNVSGGSVEDLKFSRACDSNRKDGYCSPVDNQILVSDYEQASSIVVQVVVIIGLSVAGKISDTYGRKFTLTIASVLYLISALIKMVALSCFKAFMFKTLIISDVIPSFLGGTMGLISIVNSYISDITTAENRQLAMSALFSSLFIGQIGGPLIASVFLRFNKSRGVNSEVSNIIMLWVLIVITFISFLYVVIFLPESLSTLRSKSTITTVTSSAVHDNDNDNERTNGFSSITRYLSFKSAKSGIANLVQEMKLLYLSEEFVPNEMKLHIKGLRFQVFTLTVCYAGFIMLNTIAATLLPQYGKYKFNWDASDMSFLDLFGSGTSLLGVSVIVPFMTLVVFPKWFKFSFKNDRMDSMDYSILIMGYVSFAILDTTIAFYQKPWQLYLVLALCSTVSGTVPCLSASLTKYYPVSKTSQVLMSVNIIGTVLATISRPLFLSLYKFSVRHGMPEVYFLLAAIIYMVLVCLLISAKLFTVKLP